MKNLTIAALAAATLALPASAMQTPTPAPTRAAPDVIAGRMMIYNQINYNGEEYEVDAAKRMFEWDYHPRSIAIHPGDRWQICARPRFAECIVLDRSIPDTTLIGIPAGSDFGSVRPAPADAGN
jgi:hypothetical protein